MVNITINNQYGDCDPPRLPMNNISEDITIASIKILIDNQFKCLKPDFNDDGEAKDKYVLFCGSKLLEDESYIREYNASNLPELNFHLYSKNYLTINVKTIKYVKFCGVFISPLFYKIFHRKLSFKLLDQETVLKLKNSIIQELHFYKNKQGEPLSIEAIRLLHKGFLLDDNLQLLKEVNSGNDFSLVALIPIGYKTRGKQIAAHKDAEKSSSHEDDAGLQNESCETAEATAEPANEEASMPVTETAAEDNLEDAQVKRA